MRTIVKKSEWKILMEFYKNNNDSIHLRELSRKIKLKEGPLSRHLKKLQSAKILEFKKEGNLKKFRIKKQKKPEIFSLISMSKYNDLHYLRKNAIKFYINNLKQKPVFVILFGSTAKASFKENSDIDLISVFNKRIDTKDAQKESEAQTGIKINEFQLTFNEFTKEIKLKEDPVVQAAIETGFPIYNILYYYQIKL